MKLLTFFLLCCFSATVNAAVQVSHFSVSTSVAKPQNRTAQVKAPAVQTKPVTRVAVAAKPKAVANVLNIITRNGFDNLNYCPPGRIVRTNLGLRYDDIKDKQMDVTSLDNILGYNEWTGPRVLWPYKQGFTLFKGFPRTAGAYIAAKFTVPLTSDPLQYQNMWGVESLPGPGVDMVLSEQCGDFSPIPKCSAFNARFDYFRNAVPTAPPLVKCVLIPGVTYHLNIRITNPAVQGPNCNAQTCQFGIQTNHTP